MLRNEIDTRNLDTANRQRAHSEWLLNEHALDKKSALDHQKEMFEVAKQVKHCALSLFFSIET